MYRVMIQLNEYAYISTLNLVTHLATVVVVVRSPLKFEHSLYFVLLFALDFVFTTIFMPMKMQVKKLMRRIYRN